MSSTEFFARYKGSKDMCKELQKLDGTQLAAWEQDTVSASSPGIVQNSETVYQQILDPTNLDDARTGLKPMAFDTATGIGMSTNRLEHASWAQLIERGNQRAQKFNEANPTAPKRSLWGFVPLNVNDVRSIISSHTNDRGFFVFDTATEDDPSHADICQCVNEPRNVRSIRFQLYDLVKGSILSLDQIQLP